jgi:integrase
MWTTWLVGCGFPESTLRSRVDHVRRAARALRGDPVTVHSSDILAWVGVQSWARETRRGVYASLRGFFGFLVRQGVISDDPSAALPSIRPEEPNPNPIPDATFLDALRRSDDRTELILRLAGEAGMRRGEIAVISEHDLCRTSEGWNLTVHGKGRKDRTVPISDVLAWRLRRRFESGSHWAFPGNANGHLSAKWVGKLAARVIPEPWRLHSCRHRFASASYDADSDLLAVQILLGHSSPTTTRRYIKVADPRLRKAALAAAVAA